MTDFHRLITDWYRQNKRNLPWRSTKNPYKIWLSEIILQQTRVDQGLNYYYKFIHNYPTIIDLANAEEIDILNDWQGLGYYSRARNLHFTAKQITSERKGLFPDSYQEILKLKGVGEYTAAAIASFAFELPHAVLDGNVYRVLSRVFDIELAIDSTEGKKIFTKLTQDLLPKSDVSTYNQGIMEFGALQCIPVNPECEICPIAMKCFAKKNNTILNRPVKQNKIKIKTRYLYYLIFNENNYTYIEKRTHKDIWQHLYQFPLIESENIIAFTELKHIIATKYNSEIIQYNSDYKHILSHQKLITTFIHINNFPTNFEENWVKIKVSDIQDYPIPRLIEKYLEEHVI
ncbi:MAG: A/G-specific adenine glycosylase [Flavobacteriia bacterium]|nr:A/G-specific adenine glycosylase [Flavobacteriia bacterium]